MIEIFSFIVFSKFYQTQGLKWKWVAQKGIIQTCKCYYPEHIFLHLHPWSLREVTTSSYSQKDHENENNIQKGFKSADEELFNCHYYNVQLFRKITKEARIMKVGREPDKYLESKSKRVRRSVNTELRFLKKMF